MITLVFVLTLLSLMGGFFLGRAYQKVKFVKNLNKSIADIFTSISDEIGKLESD